MAEPSAALTGGCQCGAIRYRLSAMPSGSVCHCRMCQKAVGGPFAALAALKTSDLVWVAGTPARFRSSSLATRGFCAACGTPLTYQGIDDDIIEVTICSLDQPDRVAPDHQSGMEGRRRWLDGLDTLPARHTDAKYAGVVSYQHPDRD